MEKCRPFHNTCKARTEAVASFISRGTGATIEGEIKGERERERDEQEATVCVDPARDQDRRGREKEGRRQNNVTYTDAES